METWDDSDYDANCANQNGCTNCDGDPDGSWCFSTKPECATVERHEDGVSSAGWFYCDAESPGKLKAVFH